LAEAETCRRWRTWCRVGTLPVMTQLAASAVPVFASVRTYVMVVARRRTDGRCRRGARAARAVER